MMKVHHLPLNQQRWTNSLCRFGMWHLKCTVEEYSSAPLPHIFSSSWWACSPSGAYGQAIASELSVLDTNTSIFPKRYILLRSKPKHKATISLFSIYTSLFKTYFCKEFIERILEAFSMFSVSGVSGVSGASGASFLWKFVVICGCSKILICGFRQYHLH